MSASPKVCSLWRIPEPVAIAWAMGFLTFHAIKTFSAPTCPALYVEHIEGKLAWRDLGRALQANPPSRLVFCAGHPTTLRRDQDFGMEHTYTVRRGQPHYMIAGDGLANFIAHFPPCTA